MADSADVVVSEGVVKTVWTLGVSVSEGVRESAGKGKFAGFAVSAKHLNLDSVDERYRSDVA